MWTIITTNIRISLIGVHSLRIIASAPQFAGSRKAKVLEKQLQAIIATSQPETILNTRMLIPPADFNAIFLTRHALSHFLTEGINLRHILDWHCFLNVKQNDTNWQYVYNVLEQNDMKVFADAMTAICVKHLGLKITNPEICTDSELADKILEDIFGEQRKLNRGTSGKWQNRAMIISNILGNSWRYREVYGHGIAGELFKFAYGFIFERNPHLD